MAETNVSQQIAAYLAGITFEGLPPDVVQKAKTAVLDWLGVALAGAREPAVDMLARVVGPEGGAGRATVIGREGRAGILTAALLNGVGSHLLDYDDGLLDGPGHPSVTILPALMALAEGRGYSGKALLAAYVAGIQVFFAIKAANMPEHAAEGWHSTGTVGHLAAAAACARLLELGPEQTVAALGTAATQSAGLKNVFGTMCKSLNAGKAATDGLLSALLAAEGFTAPADGIGGKDGFLPAFSLRADAEALGLALFGDHFMKILKFKAYPSCFNTHAAIDCVLALRQRYGLEPERVARIECTVYPRCLEVSANPAPRTGLEAKFSVQYCVAHTLTRGAVTLETFDDDKLDLAALDAVAPKLTLLADESLSATRSSRVAIEMACGERVEEQVSLLERSRDPEVERQDVRRKFEAIAVSRLRPGQAAEVLALVDALPEADDLSVLLSACAVAPAG